MNKTLKVILIVLAVLFAVGIIEGALNRNKTPTTRGYIMSRDAYVHNCLAGYNGLPGEDTYTQDQVKLYCGCTYDKGVAEYGAEGFTIELTNMTNNGNTFTPEMTDIVNQCVLTI